MNPDAKHDHLALREISGNLTFTVDTATAWFALASKTWAFTSDGARSHAVLETARRYAALSGTRNIHMRVTSRPYPIRLWAQRLDEDTQRHSTGLLPGCDGNTWADTLRNTQRHLTRQTLADKEVFLGVPLRQRPMFARWGEKLTRQNVRAKERAAMIEKADELAAQLAKPGTDARPATAHEVEWLMHRSVGLLLPAPTYTSPVDDPAWAQDDLEAFTDGIEWERGLPYSPTVRLIDTRLDPPVERHVTVLTVGRPDEIDVLDEPWMHRTDRLPFPVEWSARLDVVPGAQTVGEIERKLRILRDQERQYLIHDLDVPLDVAKNRADALRVVDEMGDHDPVVSTRVHGHYRIAVAAPTEKECLRRAKQVQDLYAQIHITVQHPRAQWGLLKEFIPGEPLGGTAYKRYLPVTFAAAALPQVTATVGDRRGDYIGVTSGTSQRPVMHDGHYAPEVLEASGLQAIIGEPGGGKSILLGMLAYLEARRGIITTVLDPAGPLAGLTRLPEMRGFASHVDLLNGAPGTLNPATVVADPLRGDFDDEDGWRAQMKVASRTRKMLMTDVARQLLPPEVAGLPQTRAVLGDAIRRTSGARTSGFRDVLVNLDNATKNADHAEEVAAMLRDIAEMPQAALFFPSDQSAVADVDTETTLLVLTMEGIVLPDVSAPRDTWTVEEQLSVPLLHLATYYAARRVYGVPRLRRKFIGFDEVGQMGQWASGKSLFTGLGRGSRKLNASVVASSQNPEDVIGLNVANFLSTAFVGRIEDDAIAAEALRLLKIPTGVGYEETVHNLSPHAVNGGRRASRDFIMRDPFGNREKIQVDLSHLPGVLDAIDSTPLDRLVAVL